MRTLTALLTAFLLVLTSTLYTQNDFKLGFTGAYPHNYNNPVTLQHDWGWYNDLNMNAWSGWWMGGNWGTSATGTQSVLSRLASGNINGYLQPDTIRWAGYGRVLVTEAEVTNDRFRYNNHWCGVDEPDNTQWGTGQMVRYYNKNSNCNEEDGPAGMILSGVNENCFQSIANFPYDPKYQVDFPFNANQNNPYDPTSTRYYNKYYVMPRMRISSNDVTTNKPVIKVIVKAFDGVTTVLERTINTTDFKNNGTYDGSYKEDFSSLNIVVPGDVINTGRGDEFIPKPELLANCHVDYQIYWYGEVSVWIDYVKVMDEAAYRLLNPNPFLNLDDVLQEKINFIQLNEQEDRMKGFYMEEVDYSNIACLKYLNDSLPVWAKDPDYKMIPLINWISFRGPLREGKSTDYADFLDAVQPNAIMYVAYPFEGPHGPHPPKLPNNISYFFQSYYPSIIQAHITVAYNSYKTTPLLYNQFLQSQCWDFYDRRFDTINSLCKTRGIEFYLTPQVHTWKDPGQSIDQSHREPMNSELSALFNIGICHGIKGIMPFAYESGYSFNQPLPRGGNGVIENAVEPQAGDGYSYSFGMTDFDNTNYWGVHQRTKNFYSENKWSFVADLYGKIKTWGPVLYSSTNTQGYSVHSEGADHEFITDILSIDPHKSGQNPCVEDY